MEPLIAKCGYRCDQCLAFAPNLKSDKDKQRMSEALDKYFDFQVPPEAIKPCRGCQGTKDAPDAECPVFPCARERSVETCGHCPDFGCDKLKQRMEGILDKGFTENAEVIAAEIAEINTRFRHTEELFQISYGPEGAIEGASLHEIQQMSELFDTDWAVMAGIDFADPMAIQKKARTIYTLVLKGLPGSRQNPHVFDMENAALKYIYILIRLVDVTDHTVNSIKTLINADHEQLDGIDTLCSERYGSWDLIQWCEDRDIQFTPVFPSYNVQREAFKEFYTVINEGRFKRVPIPIPGVKGNDLFEEELENFNHDPDKKWFGSPEKNEKKGKQDDSVYSPAWGIFGGKELGPADLRPRRLAHNFGVFTEGDAVLGLY